jgi:hypothetical protein
MQFALTLIAYALIIVGIIFSVIYGMFAGRTQSKVALPSGDRAQIIEDLGPLQRTFTNYTPWRFLFGALLLLSAALGAGLERITTDPGWRALMWGGLGFGVPTLIYVALMPIHRLEMHARGLVLRLGKSKIVAAYYSDIKNTYYIAVVQPTYGGSQTVAKALVIELHDGGSFRIGKNFMQFAQIAGAIHEATNLCAGYPDQG